LIGTHAAYKSQLRRRLADHGWEVVKVIDADDWWTDEFWKVRSCRNFWGFELIFHAETSNG